MSATILDTVYSQIEQVAPDLAEYYTMSTTLAKHLKPSKDVAASRYGYRYPVIKYLGGNYGKYIANGGSLGGGSSLNVAKLQFGFIDTVYGIDVTKEQMDYMTSNGSAVLDVLPKMMAGAMTEIDFMDELNLFGNGTGKLTNASSSSPSTTQLTFASPTDSLGVNRLRLGMVCDLWDATGTTKRANGPYQITDIAYGTNTVTFGSAPTGMVSTDLIAFYNLDVYGPATLVSGSSTWPGGGLTNASGLTGDSWRHGLEYVNDATTSTYYAQQLKSSFSQLVPAAVNALSSALTFDHGEALKNQIIQKRSKDALKGTMAVMHQDNVRQLKNVVTSVTQFVRTSPTAAMIDVEPTGGIEENFLWAGISSTFSQTADKARVDLFQPATWFRVQGHPTEFFKFDGGSQTIRAKTNSSGDSVATFEMKIVQKMDFGCYDPGASGYVYGLQFS